MDKVRITAYFVPVLIIGGLIAALVLVQTRQLLRQKAYQAIDSPVVKKVMVLNFNPTIESSNQTLVQLKRWNNPSDLELKYIEDVRLASGGYVNYQIAYRQDIDDIPLKKDGFDYTDDSYLACLNNSGTCHSPDGVNYQKILSDFQVCEKRNAGEIDELWLWGGPWFGYWEAVMVGPGAFSTNAPPLSGTTCLKQLHIMGFNYERGVSEMLEDLGHRAEGTFAKVFGEDPRWASAAYVTPWGKFGLSDKLAPGQSGCGWMHYAPNSASDYDWDNPNLVTSSCQDWSNYPYLTQTTQSIACSVWGCNGYGFKKWWLSHLPRYSGQTDGKWNNWWRYVLDYEEANLATTPLPSPTLHSPLSTPTPTPSSRPSKRRPPKNNSS